jgi:hypothetical protein
MAQTPIARTPPATWCASGRCRQLTGSGARLELAGMQRTRSIRKRRGSALMRRWYTSTARWHGTRSYSKAATSFRGWRCSLRSSRPSSLEDGCRAPLSSSSVTFAPRTRCPGHRKTSRCPGQTTGHAERGVVWEQCGLGCFRSRRCTFRTRSLSMTRSAGPVKNASWSLS